MRLVIDSLIVVMVLGVLGGVLYLNRTTEEGEQDTASVIAALSQLHEETEHQTAIATAVAGRETVVAQVMPHWFADGVPVNVLVGEGQPWIDLAPPGDEGIHPPDPVVTGPGQAGFWYNPTAGVFRARVMPQLSEADTLALYNQLNGTALTAFEEAPDPARQPLAYTPGQTPNTNYASPAADYLENSTTAELRVERPGGVIKPHVEPTPPPQRPQNLYEEDTVILDLDAPARPEPQADDPSLFEEPSRRVEDVPEVEDVPAQEDEPDAPAQRPTLQNLDG